jgi:hypothetical protein
MKRPGAIADEIWREAITDSGLDSSKVHRFDAVRAVTVGAGAQWWAPRESVHQPPVSLELSAEDAAAADATPLVEKHRVATAPIEGLEPRVAEAALAAKLRHELEHARQWEACGPEPFFLMQLALEVHRRKTGGIIYGAFRNQMPIEDDANAAASLFVRKRWPDCVDELRQDETYGTLARAVLGPATRRRSSSGWWGSSSTTATYSATWPAGPRSPRTFAMRRRMAPRRGRRYATQRTLPSKRGLRIRCALLETTPISRPFLGVLLVPNRCPNVRKPARGGMRLECHARVTTRVTKPLPATFPDRSPLPR